MRYLLIQTTTSHIQEIFKTNKKWGLLSPLFLLTIFIFYKAAAKLAPNTKTINK